MPRRRRGGRPKGSRNKIQRTSVQKVAHVRNGAIIDLSVTAKLSSGRRVEMTLRELKELSELVQGIT